MSEPDDPLDLFESVILQTGKWRPSEERRSHQPHLVCIFFLSVFTVGKCTLTLVGWWRQMLSLLQLCWLLVTTSSSKRSSFWHWWGIMPVVCEFPELLSFVSSPLLYCFLAHAAFMPTIREFLSAVPRPHSFRSLCTLTKNSWSENRWEVF